MFLKLEYVFAPLYHFFLCELEFVHILLDILGLTPFNLNKKNRKRTDIFWVKT